MRDNLTQQQAARPLWRTVSVLIPQARLLNQAQELLTGKCAFAGSGEVALRATESPTGPLVAAGLDRRSGGGRLEQAVVWQWGDAKAMDVWSQRSTQRLVELRAKGRVR